MKITKTEYVKKEVEVEIDLPTETVYYFLTGYRNSFRLVPKYYKEELHSYYLTEIHNEIGDIFIKHHSQILIRNIPDILENDKSPFQKYFYHVVNFSEHNKRTKEQFEQDLKSALYVINRK